MTDYTFKTTTELMKHQQSAFDKVAPLKVGGLLMEMGTGKSRTIIEVVHKKLIEGKIDRVIWYCPVSLKITVRDEILKHTTSTASDINRFGSSLRKSNVNMNAFWHIIGIESMSSSNKCVVTANMLTDDRTMVIVDESSYIKTHNSIRTKRISYISRKAKYRYILTGTPMTQGVVDLYSQFSFLSPKILGYNSFYSFSANHLTYCEDNKGMIISSHNTGYIASKINPYVYQVKKDECLDLPPKTFSTSYFDMTRDQRALYDLAKYEILEQIWDEDKPNGYVIFKLFSALQQITSGFYMDGDVFHECDHNRIKTLLSTIESIPPDEKVIIWCKYIHSVESICDALNKAYGDGSTVSYTGKLSEDERNDNVNKFKSSARFFVATQQSGGHGLTLNESSYTVFYENEFKFANRLQAEDRNHRIGQGNSVTYIDIVCNRSIDGRIMRSQLEKGNTIARFKSRMDKMKVATREDLLKMIEDDEKNQYLQIS